MLPHKNLWIRRYMDDLQYSDSDTDDKVEPVSQEILDRRESNKNAFRAKILDWKRKQIDDITRESQDTTVLNKYLRDSADLYKKIKDKLEGRTELVGGGGIDFNLNVSSGMERADQRLPRPGMVAPCHKSRSMETIWTQLRQRKMRGLWGGRPSGALPRPPAGQPLELLDLPGLLGAAPGRTTRLTVLTFAPRSRYRAENARFCATARSRCK